MPKLRKVSVNLPEKVYAKLIGLVEEGYFRDVSEVIRHAITVFLQDFEGEENDK